MRILPEIIFSSFFVCSELNIQNRFRSSGDSITASIPQTLVWETVRYFSFSLKFKLKTYVVLLMALTGDFPTCNISGLACLHLNSGEFIILSLLTFTRHYQLPREEISC